MSDPTVEANYAVKFTDDFMLLAQQRESRLAMAVRDDPTFLEGKYGYFDRIAPTTGQSVTSRHAPTPSNPIEHSRRRIIRTTYNTADMIDRRDIRRMMKNPQSAYLQSMVAWAMRTKDDVIIAAANGSAYSIDEDESATEVALPSAQKIAVGGTRLTYSKLNQAREILDAAEIYDEDRFLIITAKQETDLLNITEIKSRDFNERPVIRDGKVDRIMGFNVIRTERLTSSGGSRLCLAFARSAIGLAADARPLVRVTEESTRSYNWQLYLEFEAGATRIEDERLVQIACSES